LGSRLAGDRVIRKKMQAVRGSENSFDHKLDGEYTEKKMKMETNAGPDGSESEDRFDHKNGYSEDANKVRLFCHSYLFFWKKICSACVVRESSRPREPC
jgi:hypothetical protein